MSDGYNGWKNYPTWCVTLWLDNNPDSQAYSHAVVLRAYKQGLVQARTNIYTSNRDDEEHKSYARSIAADRLKEYVEQLLNDDRADMGSDLQSWALGQVNWREIVTTWLEDDLKEDEDEEEN